MGRGCRKIRPWRCSSSRSERTRHELYCEASPKGGETAAGSRREHPAEAGSSPGIKQKFSDVLAAAEHDRSRRASGDYEPPASLWGRIKARSTGLDCRRHRRAAAALVLCVTKTPRPCTIPSDLVAERALEITRASLARDRDRHFRWLVIDSVLMLLSVGLVLVPGPNVLGYYFAFRVVGHFLAWRGARQGLDWRRVGAARLRAAARAAAARSASPRRSASATGRHRHAAYASTSCRRSSSVSPTRAPEAGARSMPPILDPRRARDRARLPSRG